MSAAASPHTAYSVSWNLTQRCNLECAHCYMSAHAGADTRGELSTAECRRVMDEIAAVNPNVFLILTGGEPLLRRDIWDLAACAADKKFTTVFGTNGVLLREREARLMREHGVLGASISLDSTDRVKHDAFRRLPGAWDAAVRATRVLTDEGLDFSLHMSVTDWNVKDVPAMIDLARALGAKVLNFFFLVRTGRGRDLTDIDAAAYEEILTYLAKAQGVGQGPPSFVRRMLGMADAAPAEKVEDRWSTPVGLADDPAGGYHRGAHGGSVIDLPATLTFGLPVDYELSWELAARERLDAIPSFARGMVVRAVEAYARWRGESVITPALLADVRARWGGRFRQR